MAGRHSASRGSGHVATPQTAGRHSAPHAAAEPLRIRFALVALTVLLVVGGGIAYVLNRQDDKRPVAADSSTTSSGSAAPSSAQRCTEQLAVPVVVSPELATVVTKLAAEWQATQPTLAGRCLSATVTPQDSVAAAAALTGVRRPVVWIPDSSIWSTRLAAAHRSTVRIQASVATSPLVVAAAPTSAAVLRRAATTGWTGLLRGTVPLRITDPDTTAAGALTTLNATAHAGTSASAQTTLVGLFLRLQNATLRSASAGFAALRADPRSVPGFVASERDVVAANAQHGSAVAAAVYPAGPTPLLDYPLVQVMPTHSAQLAISAATAFGSVLRTATARAAFTSIGLRDAHADPLPAAEASGAAAFPRVRPAGAAPAAVQAVETRLWRAASKPSQLLSVIDVSGSMKDRVRRGASKKITIAASAAQQALRVLPDDWTVGLWTFATHPRPATDWTELVSLRGVHTGRARLLAAAATLPRRVGGNTALYSTALAAFNDVSAHYNPSAVNVVVLLTDGSNVDPGTTLSLKKLLATLGSRYNPRKPVRIVTIAFGHDADVSALRKISAATHGQSYRVEDAAEIQAVIVQSVIANNP
jgi:Ca-activated chloride channel family protein